MKIPKLRLLIPGIDTVLNTDVYYATGGDFHQARPEVIGKPYDYTYGFYYREIIAFTDKTHPIPFDIGKVMGANAPFHMRLIDGAGIEVIKPAKFLTREGKNDLNLIVLVEGTVYWFDESGRNPHSPNFTLQMNP